MTIYLVKGYLDVAATTLADAQSLITALADQTDPDNLTTIARVTDKLETLVQSDSGEPLVISSIDDAAGTISSWVTNTTEQLAFAIGDPSATTDLAYTVANVSTIAGNTRTGTLALNTDRLQCAVSGSRGMPPRGQSPQFLAHIRRSNVTTGYTETVARLPFQVLPGVLLSTTQEADEFSASAALTYAQQSHDYANLAQNYSNTSQTYSSNSNTYAFASFGYSTDSQNYANWSRANANLAQGYAQNSQNFSNTAATSNTAAGVSAAAAAASAAAAAASNTAAGLSAVAANANAAIAQNYATPNGTTVLTPGANVSWNMAANVCASLIANQNFNLTITGFADGGTGLLAIKQNASGNWVASSWAATAGNIAWPGNVAPTITTTANFIDEFSFVTRGTTLRGAYVQNYAQ